MKTEKAVKTTVACQPFPTLREYIAKHKGPFIGAPQFMIRTFRLAYIAEREDDKPTSIKDRFPEPFENDTDFLRRYGSINADKLDWYYVVSDDNDGLSLLNKRLYDEKHSPVTIDGAAHAIILDFINSCEDVLAGDYPVLDCGSGLDVIEEFTMRIKKLSTRQKNKIRSIFLGHKYTKNKKED